MEKVLKTELERERRKRRRAWLFAIAVIAMSWAGPALSVTQVPYIFSPNTPARASEINANFAALANAIDSVEAMVQARLSALETRPDFVPAGTIAFFATAICPAGWTAYQPLEGRYVVGVTQGGSTEEAMGIALSDLEDREHIHSISHRHEWSHYNSGTRTWSSFKSANLGTSRSLIADWGSGIGNNSGRYPLEYEEGEGSLYTGDPTVAQSGVAKASDIAPYIQLLACQRLP